MKTLIVKKQAINITLVDNEEYISLTDIARYKNRENPKGVIQNWIRNRNTIEFLGIWELIHNPNFKGIEFEAFKKEAGLNSFTLAPQKWIESTDAIGLVSKSGKGGGTYAHRDIAFEFASWVSVEFKIYLIQEFERLKENEQREIGWSAKRELSKINYIIHTDAIKNNLIPKELTNKQVNLVYDEEADVLNMALFGMTAKEWREKNPNKKGNIRDYAGINELICLANLENTNSIFINEGMRQSERLYKLNQIAISQMKILTKDIERKLLKENGKIDSRILFVSYKKYKDKTGRII